MSTVCVCTRVCVVCVCACMRACIVLPSHHTLGSLRGAFLAPSVFIMSPRLSQQPPLKLEDRNALGLRGVCRYLLRSGRAFPNPTHLLALSFLLPWCPLTSLIPVLVHKPIRSFCFPLQKVLLWVGEFLLYFSSADEPAVFDVIPSVRHQVAAHYRPLSC